MGIEVVTISLTDSTGAIDPTGATVTITNTDLNVTLLSTTWQSEPIIANISTNTNYTVSVSAVEGVQPSSQSYKAGWKTARNVTFDYISNGVFVSDLNKKLYTASAWSAAISAGTKQQTDALGIAVLTENHKFLIAPERFHRVPFTTINGSSVTPTSPTIYNNDNRNSDYAGLANTNTWRSSGYSYIDNTCAVNVAVNYTFRDGLKGGYIPACGQFNIMCDNKTQLLAAITAIGSNMSPTNDGAYYNYFSSTNRGYDGNYGGCLVFCCWTDFRVTWLTPNLVAATDANYEEYILIIRDWD